MSIEPLVSQQVKTPNKFLWAVKTYYDLISRDDMLVYGSGLKRLFVMSSGVATLNDRDIEAIAEKAERLQLMPERLHGFMMACVTKNIELYGKELQRLIRQRVVSIANGDVRNPDPLYKFSADEARRHFYVPPHTYVKRLLDMLQNDHGLDDFRWAPPVTTTMQDIANESDMILSRMQIDEGHITPIETSWMALLKGVDGVVGQLEREAAMGDQRDYRRRARGGLKILWFIAKVLMGDLTVKPLPKDINMVDLQQKLSFTDGTLAAIPFPIPGSVDLFQDNDQNGISMKGRIYLSAVSAAAFYLGAPSEDY